MHALFAMLLIAVTPADYEVAQRDRAQFSTHEHGYLYYISTSHLSGEAREKTNLALRLRIASTSKNPIVEQCTPVEVAPGLLRIDLQQLQWDWRLWQKLLEKHPYNRQHKLPLVVHGGWLLTQISDGTESTAYYELLYGTAKLDRADFEKAWGVNAKQEDSFGIIGKGDAPDGPAHVAVRWIERNPTSKGVSRWFTRDSAKLNLASDPVEHLRGDFKHEAEEHFAFMPKVSITTGERGALLASLLTDAKGKRQEEAPAKIVTDRHGFRGQAAIRNPGSCVSCHANGMREPGVNQFRAYIADGIEAYSDKKLKEQLELFHLSENGKQLLRDNEDFATGVELVCGCDGATAAEAFSAALDLYDRDVDLAAAAAEYGLTPKELQLALANYNDGKQGARFAALAHDKPIPRNVFEDLAYTIYVAVNNWEKKR